MKRHPLKTIYQFLLPLLILFAIALQQKMLFGFPINEEIKKDNYSIDLKKTQSVFPNTITIKAYGPFTIAMDSISTLGFLGHSAFYASHVRGYNGKVPLIVAIDSALAIRDVIILPNKETGDFVEILRKRNFSQAWNGISIHQIAEHKVDAISGATETAVAIEQGLKLTIEGMTRFMSIETNVHLPQNSNKRYIQLLSQLALLIIALLSFFMPKQFRRYRIALLIASVIILGFWTSLMLTHANLYNLLINGFNLSTQIVLIAILVISLGFPIFIKKNIYCQNICPFGALQEICYKIPNKKLKIPYNTYTYLVHLKQIYLLIIIGILLIGWGVDLSKLEPFIAFRIHIVSNTMLFFFIIVMLLSTIINKPWCKYLCPTGLCLDLLKYKEVKK